MLNNLLKFLSVVFLLAIFLFPQNSFAQLQGTKNIPGDYATLAAAIADLNTQGVGSGGVTLNLIAGNPETAPVGGYVIGGTGSLVLTTTNATDQIIIQGNGNTITANSGLTAGALNDAIFKLIGADYVTITGFTMLENPLNTITTAASNNMTEFGVALFYVTTTDGANNNKITNCTIDLDRTYQNTFGIYANATHSSTAMTTSATATGLLGGNSGLVITGNTITDVNNGIVIVGPTAAADMNDGVTIGGSLANANTITNFGTTGTFSGYANVSGTVNGILIRNTKNYTISYNTITSSVGGVTAGTLNGIQQPAFSSTPTGTFTNSISNNTFSLQPGAASITTNGINCPSGSASTTSTFNINNNNFVNFGHTVAGTGAITFISNVSTHQNMSISNNTFTNITVNTTGSVTFISNSFTMPAGGTQNINNNSIVGSFSKTGAGGTVQIYTSGSSSPAGTVVNNNNNNFSNITVTGATTLAGWNQNDGGAPTKTIQNNTFNNWTGGTSAISYAMTCAYSTYPSTVTGNTITNITGQGAVTGLIIGTSSAYDVYSNTINNLSSTGTGGTVIGLSVTSGSNNVYNHNIYALSSTGASAVNGISVSGATLNKVYNNNVYNLTSSNAGGSVNGMIISSGTAVYAYNNFISDLKAPNLNAATSLNGINISGGTTVGLYYNTIFLNATSTGALFGSAGIYASTTPSVDMRNNIVVNTSTPNGATGFTTAYRRTSTTLTTYASTSNNNAFYAGTPGTNNLLFYDGTNSDQTMATYKTRVAPRDAASFSENVAFVNTTTAPYDLHINPTVPTQLESGGTPITTPVAITTDYDGDTRNATTPDIGADEGNFQLLDLIAPSISYTALGPTGSTTNRTLTAAITDPSGVPTSGLGLPVLYWKIGANGTYTAATGSYVSGNNYSFSFGGGVTAGDTVFYYVAAQDAATTPNVGVFPSAGASGFTANPPAASTPPTAPSSYLVVGAPLAGNYTVGSAMFNQITGRNITFEKVVTKVMKQVWVEKPSTERTQSKTESLDRPAGEYRMMEVEEVSYVAMENGKPFTGDLYVKRSDNPELGFAEGTEGIYATITAAVNDLNTRGLSAPVNFLLTDTSYTAETLPITVNIISENLPTATNKVTIKPNTGVTATVSGAFASGPLFRIRNSYVTIDGSNAGSTDKSLTLSNTSTTSPQVVHIASSGTTPIVGAGLKNCIVINGVNTSSAVVVSDLAGTAGYFNNITIQNNSVQKAYVGIYSIAVVAAGNGSGLLIANNDLSTSGTNAVRYVGVYVQGVDGAVVRNNTIANFSGTDGEDDRGVWFATGTSNSTIEANYIHTLKYTGTGGYGAYGMAISTGVTNANIVVKNNMIYNLSGDGWSYTSVLGDNTHGIYIFSTQTGIKVYHNSINLYGNTLNQSSAIATGITLGTGSTADLKNNIIVNNLGLLSATGYGSVGIYVQTANTQLEASNYNDIYVNPTGSGVKFVGQIASTGSADLTAWQTASLQDANSLSADPKFVSNTDLHIDPIFNIVDAKGFYLASVPVDIDGQTRNTSTPDIGADEYVYTPPTVNDPTGVTATAISFSQIDVAFTRNANLNNVLIVWNNTGTFTAPVGAPPAVGQPFAGGTVLYYGATSPVNHTGLTASTLYYYKVFSYDGSIYSSGVTANATTLAAPISTFPYSQNFTGTFPPTGWQNYGSRTWSQSTTGGIGSSACARATYSPAGTANLQMPNVILPATPSYRIKFWWKNNDISARPLGDGPEIVAHDTTYFEISTDGGTNWTALAFLSAVSSQSAFEESVNDISSYAGQTVQLRWRYVTDGTFSAYGVGLDDILIEEIPAGPIFSISPTSKNFGPVISGNSSAPQNFTITNGGAADLIINTGGVTITGTDASQFSLGSITYPITIAPGGNAVVTVTFSPTSAGAKTASLQIVHNAPGSPSTVALSGNGLAVGVLWEDFTDVNALARWKVVNLDGGTSTWARTTTKFNSSPASAGCLYESDARQNNDWLISPKLTVANGDSLTFYHSIQSATYPESLYVKVGTTNDPTTGTWTNLAVIYDNTTTWKYKKYDLSAYAGQQIYVAFVDRSQDQYVLYIDDITGPVVYVPAVDLAFTDFYQESGLPVPKSGERFSDYRISMSEAIADQKPVTKLLSNVSGERSTNVNNTTLLESDNSVIPIELNNISVKAFVKNFGTNSASYNLGWSVDGVAQTPYSGPSVAPGAMDSTVLTFAPTDRGTFFTAGNLTVTADENPDNNTNNFRMRVYPDAFTRTIYDRGDNVLDTWVGWGSAATQMKAGVRFTATSDIKLAGVDFIYNTESITSGDIIVQVRAAGDSTTAPGAVLYTKVFSTTAYFPGGGDYIHLPFGSDAPVIASGSDYWITVKFPLGILYPGGVHNNGFTAGRSFYEGSTDTTVWNPLVITTERAWIMRSVEVAAGPATFQLSVNVLNGWNMVSIPGLHPTDQNVNTWWNFRDPLASVYKWSGGAYNPVTTATPTEGYWLLHSGARTYNTGDEWPAGGIQLVNHDPIAVTSGWNMIGGYDNSASVSGLTTTPPGLIVPGTVYGWNGGYYNPTNLEPGYGYWILLTGSGVINPPTALKGGSTAKETNTEGWGKIIVTDASGKSYTLYSVKGEVNLMEYQLPPLPPAGLFDVRFGSGRKAEDLKTSQTIEMQGLVYPIVVKSENMDIRLQDVSGTVVNQSLKSGESVTISNSSVSKLMVSATVIPDKYSLEQNYPNPFNPSTVISFSLPEDASNVRLTIYDALGQKVAELVNGKLEAGKYQYSWNAGNNATGLYIYELRTDKFVSVKKMMLMK